MPVDQAKLEAFMGKAVGDIGATMSAVLVMIGEKLGLYKALQAAGRSGMTATQLASKTHTAERYVREWLLNQAAGGYVEYDKAAQRFWITEEQAMALADESSPVYIHGAFDIAMSMFMDQPKIERAFRTGEGVDWGDHHPCLFTGTERFFRPGYQAHLVASWLPALDGVVGKLNDGATVADIGCGHGASTILMARAFVRSEFVGFDAHAPSIQAARKAAEKAKVTDNLRFEVASANNYSRPERKAGGVGGYDLIACFDCLHDMGDPVGAARHAHGSLKRDGTWMIVEPFAGDKVEDNLNPVGRVYSAASTTICVPASLAHHGPALGAQAGETRLRDVVMQGGFKRFRKAVSTPFNLVLEARP